MANDPVTNKSPITEASVRCTVAVNNAAKSDEWETASGGSKSAAVQQTRVGYSPNTVVTMPSVSSSAPVTLTRKMVVADVWELQATLLEQVGVGTAAVWLTPMDRLGSDNYAHAKDTVSLVYVGLITDVTVVAANNESTTPATISMTLTGGHWTKAT